MIWLVYNEYQKLHCFQLFWYAAGVVNRTSNTSGVSEILCIIMEPLLAMISHIAKVSFDLKNRLDKHYPNGTTLSTCDIKSLYINIWFDIFYTTFEYWIEK